MCTKTQLLILEWMYWLDTFGWENIFYLIDFAYNLIDFMRFN